MSSQIKETSEFLKWDSFIYFLPEHLHQTFQVFVITEDVVLCQDVLETSGWNISFILQVNEPEIIFYVDGLVTNLLFEMVDVGMHVCWKSDDFEYEFGRIFLEGVLNRVGNTGTLC